ncbi:acetylornithine deacetylase [Rhizobiales bacterium GAS113]|nr:acetylornithine deacetylase [Rhizobiales bacterium GAS113]
MPEHRDRLVELLRQVVVIPTAYPPGDTTQLAAAIVPRLNRPGYRTDAHAEVAGLVNVVASIGEGAPHLVFNAHVDTVGFGERASWRTDPFVLPQAGDRLYGLGASNWKDSMAVQLWLAEQIMGRGSPARGTVTFTFVSDEEGLGGHGMAYLCKAGPVKPDMLFLGAPTSNALIPSERGVNWGGIETSGKAAHAGAPEMGDNAVERMLRLVAFLQRALFPRLAARRDADLRLAVNIGGLQGGENPNVAPGRCRLELDRRHLPTETVNGAYAEIVAALQVAGEPEGTWSSELMRGTNSLASARDGALVTTLAAVVARATGEPARFAEAIGASDGRWLANDGIEIVNFGPGGGSEGHAANDFVDLAELETSAAIHLAFVEQLVGLRG